MFLVPVPGLVFEADPTELIVGAEVHPVITVLIALLGCLQKCKVLFERFRIHNVSPSQH